MDTSKLPAHIAIIMDGNGRWAEARQGSRFEGHRQGAVAVRRIVTAARELGIKHLTLFAFSTENWGRPALEVGALMALLNEYLVSERAEILENDIRLTAVGQLWRLPAEVRATLEALIDDSAQNTGMTLCLALSFGGREELAQAARSLAEDVARGELKPEDVDETTLAERLWSRHLPPPDLVIRTSGEQRVSNFLLWGLAYSELYFTRTLWPDFDKAELVRAIDDYQSRQRRFGLVGGANSH